MGSPSRRPPAARIVGIALVPLAAVAIVSGCGHGSHHDAATASDERASSPAASSVSPTAPDELADPATLTQAGESTVAERTSHGSASVALGALSAARRLIVRWSCSSSTGSDTLTLSYSDGRTSSSPCDAGTASAVLSADLPLRKGARPTAVSIAAKASTSWRLVATESA